MSKDNMTAWKMSCLVAKAILHNRQARRKVGVKILLVILVLFTLGVFLIGGWLESDPILFGGYWGGVFILSFFLMLLALYDALRTIGEVRAEHEKSMAKDMGEIAKLLKQAEEEELEETIKEKGSE